MPYYSGQGKLYIADRDVNGNPGAFRYLGNVPSLNLNLATEKVEHKESTSGQRLTDATIQTGKQMTLSFALEEFTAENLALAFYGTTVSTVGASVTGEVAPAGLVTGDIIKLKHPKVSAVTVVDSAGTPVTLATPAGWVMESADHGLLRIVAPTGTQPFKVNYTYAGYKNTMMFKSPSKERWLHFAGLNTADSSKPVVIDLYKVVMDPISDFAALNDEIASFTLEAEALYDATKEADAALGGFGRVLIPT